jgi:hypothetical protein
MISARSIFANSLVAAADFPTRKFADAVLSDNELEAIRAPCL